MGRLRDLFSLDRPGGRAGMFGAQRMVGGKPEQGQASSRTTIRWQDDAWRYFDLLGPIKYASGFYAKIMRNVRFYVAEVDTNGDVKELTSGPFYDALAILSDPGGGRSALQSRYGAQRFIAGESYLVATRQENTEWRWEMLSNREIRVTNEGKYQRIRTRGATPVELTEAPVDATTASPGEVRIYRLWRNHPEFSDEPDSPMQGVLDDCRELALAGRRVRSQLRSHLLNRILAVPSELVFAGQDDDEDEGDSQSSPFMRHLERLLTLVIDQEDSVQSVAPAIVHGDADDLKPDAFRLITLTEDDFATLGPVRKEAIERIAVGLDMPPEILLGLGKSNHWNAFEVDDQVWESHGRPVVEDFADELADIFIGPLLAAMDNPPQIIVAADVSEIVNHPNRGRDAKDAHDRLAISDAKLRDVLGFDEGDAPDQAEYDRRVALWRKPSRANSDRIQGQASLDERVRGAVELAVRRSMEVAGSRVRSAAQRVPDLAAAIAGAPDAAAIPRLLGRATVAALGNGTPMMDVDLTRGTTQGLRAQLGEWGVKAHVVDHLCTHVETHAAHVLFDEGPRDFPEALRILVEEAQ